MGLGFQDIGVSIKTGPAFRAALLLQKGVSMRGFFLLALYSISPD